MSSNIRSLREERLLPNGVDLVGEMHANVVDNLRRDLPSAVNLPPIWRLAKLVTSERAPLELFKIERDR